MDVSSRSCQNVEGFEYLSSEIGDAEVIEQIPVVKTDIHPAYAMDVNNLTVSGNIRVIECLKKQAGLGGPDDDNCIDITDSVVIIHGDLGTGERINSIRKRRSIEDRPWERFQYTKYCPGLFHLKMAAAEALWRIALKPKLAQEDETCLMKDVGVLRPKETGKIASKFEFRRTHQVVKHAGLARRLDCWRVAVKTRYPEFATLEDFAKSKPKLDVMKAIAKELVDEHVADYTLSWKRMEPAEDRDEQFENASLIMKYLLLYEELAYAMNFGDIGRLERCLLQWIPLFKATGKHKYATAMEKFLVETHFECPEALRRAIRYNILINPTGKPGKFRGVDWVVESHNCEIKVFHGGQGSNRSVQRMIAESALIGTYRAISNSVESNLLLYTTTAHGEPNMKETFKELHQSLSQCSPHVFVPGRKSKYSIPDMLNRGAALLCNKWTGNDVNEDEADDNVELQPEMEDIVAELL